MYKWERPLIRSFHCIPFRFSYCQKSLGMMFGLAYPYPNFTILYGHLKCFYLQEVVQICPSRTRRTRSHLPLGVKIIYLSARGYTTISYLHKINKLLTINKVLTYWKLEKNKGFSFRSFVSSTSFDP